MKLFKKVSAAILAGVMALSMMVGCASTVTPGTPDVLPDVPATPDAGSAAEIINIMNIHNTARGLSTVSNDAVLADKAATLIDAILASANNMGTSQDGFDITNDAATVGNEGQIVLRNETVRSAFNSAVTTIIPNPDANVFYTNGFSMNAASVAHGGADYTNGNGTFDGMIVPISSLVYTADNMTKVALENFAESAVQAGTKIGVATKKVGIYTVALIVTENTITLG